MKRLATGAGIVLLLVASPALANGGPRHEAPSFGWNSHRGQAWLRLTLIRLSEGHHFGWYKGKHWGWFKPHHPHWPHHDKPTSP